MMRWYSKVSGIFRESSGLELIYSFVVKYCEYNIYNIVKHFATSDIVLRTSCHYSAFFAICVCDFFDMKMTNIK